MKNKSKSKNDVEVLINGRRYTICGFESVEYLQKVATYINSKYAEFKDEDYYYALDIELRNILLAINIADDYFKSEKERRSLTRDNERKDKMVLEMKHEIMDMQSKSDNVENRRDELKGQLDFAEKKIVALNVKNQDSSSKLETLEEKLTAARSENSSHAAKLETAVEQVKKLEDEIARLKKRNDSLNEKVKTQADKMKAAEQKKKALEGEKKELKEKLDSAEKQVKELGPQIDLEKENTELKAKLQAAERRITDLEARNRKGKR